MTVTNHKMPELPFRSTPNHGGEISPRIIVLNYTLSRTLISTVRWMSTSESQASAHIIIGRDGKAMQMLPFNIKAWHCGFSEFKGLSRCNDFSIGVELCNWGPLQYKHGMYQTWAKTTVHDDDVVQFAHDLEPGKQKFWERYREEQIASCISICKKICEHYPIEAIVGHSDIARPLGRSLGPGPAFDINKVREEVGIGYCKDTDDCIKSSNFELYLLRNEIESVLKKVNRFLDRRSD